MKHKKSYVPCASRKQKQKGETREKWDKKPLDHWTGVRVSYIKKYALVRSMYEEHIWKHGKRRGMSPRTLKTYSHCVSKFFRIYHKPPHKVTKNDILGYVDQMIEWGRAGKTINVHVNALKFFFEKCLGRKLTVNVPLIKKRKRYPEFLEQNEVMKLINNIKNSKHKLLVTFAYSCGVRVSELVHLKVKDFQFDAGYLWVRQGKGGKDRAVPLSDHIKPELVAWIKQNGLGSYNYLFTGRGAKPYSTASVRAIIKAAMKKAGISKNITPHSLRHSFATHFMEQGNSLVELQPLLGHSNLETTMIYAHLASPKISNMKSPLDGLKK